MIRYVVRLFNWFRYLLCGYHVFERITFACNKWLLAVWTSDKAGDSIVFQFNLLIYFRISRKEMNYFISDSSWFLNWSIFFQRSMSSRLLLLMFESVVITRVASCVKDKESEPANKYKLLFYVIKCFARNRHSRLVLLRTYVSHYVTR